MEKISTRKEYQEYVNKKSPNSPIIKNCFNSFWVGGLICLIRSNYNGNMQIQGYESGNCWNNYIYSSYTFK